MEPLSILRKVQSGHISLREAERLLRLNAVASVGAALKLDLGREERTGAPEVILAEGKRPKDLLESTRLLLKERGLAILTRCAPKIRLRGIGGSIEHHASGVVVVRPKGARPRRTGGRVALLTGGASDARVAEEAEAVAVALGCTVDAVRDVGVASLSRTIDAVRRLTAFDPHVWIVVAGREGALAPVVAGLVRGPVIGVPVSTGYGHRGRGEAALSTMLQACTPLLTVNIDAGFVAGAAAAQIANRIAAAERP